MKIEKETRMYREAKPFPSFFVGCNFRCKYCEPSFQRQMKRRKRVCYGCYEYNPHAHWERFKLRPPRTRKNEFIFINDFGDVAFAPHEFMLAQIGYCYQYPDRTFLQQSKDPRCFLKYRFPDNVILGTTIETNNYVFTKRISKAPPPSERYSAMLKLKHPRKAVTIEPIMKFDSVVIVKWICDINPEVVYTGYDSHPKTNKLPEPSLSETKDLIKELAWRLDNINVNDEEIVSGAVFGRVRCKEFRKACGKNN